MCIWRSCSGFVSKVDGTTNVRTCFDVPETHLVGVLVFDHFIFFKLIFLSV